MIQKSYDSNKMTSMGKYIQILVAALVLSLFASDYAFAADKDSLWVKANDAYSLGEYENAFKIYKEIEKEGFVSARLWYNMGNACYKLQHDGMAILYYERALKLDPSNTDIKNNLEIARLKTLDKIESVPEFILTTWVKDLRNTMSSNKWAWFGISMLVVTMILLLLFRHAPSIGQRKLSFVFACIFLVIVIISFIFSLNLKGNAERTDTAIVLTPVTNVKSAPNSTGGNLFILHEGTKVEVLEKAGQWSKIELTDGRQGWMVSKDFEII